MRTLKSAAALPVHASSGYAAGVLLIVLAGITWSTMGLGVRSITHATAFQILFYRSLGILPVLFIFIAIRSRGHPLAAIGRVGTPGIIGALCLIVAFTGSIVAMVETSIANAFFLFSVSPLFSGLLARIFLGEKLRLATWIFMLIGLCGVLVMVVDGISAGKVMGNVAAILSALGFASFTLSVRWEKSADSLPSVFLAGIFATLAMGVAATVAGQGVLISPHDTAVALTLGMVVLSGGLILYTLGSRHVPAGEAALLSLFEVVLGPFWVFLVFSETPRFYGLVGGAILLLALAGNAVSGMLAGRGREPAVEEEQEDPAAEWEMDQDLTEPPPPRPPIRRPAMTPARVPIRVRQA